MKLLNILKKEKETTPLNKNALNINLTDGEIIFLEYIEGHSTDINTYSKKYLYDYDLDYKETVKKLLSLKLICIGTPEQSLSLYKANDLKNYLKSNGLPTSGKKDDLIQRIITQTQNYANFFHQRIYSLTEIGRTLISNYEINYIQSLKKSIFDTITYIRNEDIESIYKIYETKTPSKNPIALPYDKENIKKDVDAINKYRLLGHDTNRELVTCIVSIMFHKEFYEIVDLIKKIGYTDITESEIYSVSASISSLKNISEFQEIEVKNYEISTCEDERVCDKCKNMNKKIYPVSKAKLGVTLPPFCNNCRCIILAIFE